MPDDAPPIVAASPGEIGTEALSGDAVEAILADFRAWLQEANSPGPLDRDGEGRSTPLSPWDSSEFDIATILQHFIALRQEINLQTKASRGQLEHSVQTLAMMQEALGTIERQQAQLEENRQNVQDEIVRPFLKTLIDAHDALALAERKVRRVLESSPPTSPEDAPPLIKLRIPHWARWMGLDASIEAQLAPLYAWQKARQPVSDPAGERFRQSLDALRTGYRMSLQRIERALAQSGVESFTCVGAPFDPERMEVAEVVREEGRAKTEVIGELRPGYLWRGRLFRCAQVRVAKP